MCLNFCAIGKQIVWIRNKNFERQKGFSSNKIELRGSGHFEKLILNHFANANAFYLRFSY